MFEHPEFYTLAGQMRQTIIGKTIISGEYVNPNANIFLADGAVERFPLLFGGSVTNIEYHAPDIYVQLNNGYGLLILQGGGKILYNESSATEPRKYHFRFAFYDGSSLTYAVRLWSYGIDAIAHEEWTARKIRTDEERLQAMDATFNEYLQFIYSHPGEERQSIKTYLAKRMAGIMSTFAGEILLYAGIHPTRQMLNVDGAMHARIFDAMHEVLTRACEGGGRDSKVDLHGNPGRYVAMTERKHIGDPCPRCSNPLEKISVAGVTAYCSHCQK